MKHFKSYWQLAIGILLGCSATVGAALLWLSSGVTLKGHGEVVITDFPKWIKTATFDNDLVTISVTDFTYHRDVAFEPNLQVTCKDREYGSIVGMPYKEHFFFQYENSSKGLIGTPPINDVNGIHPTTKIKEAQQDAP
jgi:hypothetical protein